MPDREITKTEKCDGVVSAVAGAFGVRSKAAATVDIQNLAHTYHAVVNGERRQVVVVIGEDGRFLRTVEDLAAPDPLLDLPDIEARA